MISKLPTSNPHALSTDPVFIKDVVPEIAQLLYPQEDQRKARNRVRRVIAYAIDQSRELSSVKLNVVEDIAPDRRSSRQRRRHRPHDAIPRAQFCEWALRQWGEAIYKLPGYPLARRIAPVGIAPLGGAGDDPSVVSWRPDDPAWLRDNYRKLVAERAAVNAENTALRKRLAQVENEVTAINKKRAAHSKKMSDAGKKGGRGNAM